MPIRRILSSLPLMTSVPSDAICLAHHPCPQRIALAIWFSTSPLPLLTFQHPQSHPVPIAVTHILIGLATLSVTATPLSPLQHPRSHPAPMAVTHLSIDLVTLPVTATPLSPLQHYHHSSVHTDAISVKTATVTPFAIARVQRHQLHALTVVTMSPTTMATLIANVPLLCPLHPLLPIAPQDVPRTQITGALHTADVTHHIHQRPPILNIQPHLLHATLHAITSMIFTATHTVCAMPTTRPLRIFHAITPATTATTTITYVTVPAARRLQLNPATTRVATNTITTVISIALAT